MPYNSTSFKIGNIRSKESIEKQSQTMKRQFALKERTTPSEFISTPGYKKSYKKHKTCEKCGKPYFATANRQRWCLECVPNNYHRRIIQRYNLSKSEFDNLIIINDGSCWICLKNKAKVVDHDHKTGKVRGLLCNHCNLALNLIQDEKKLKRALSYLKGGL